MINKILFDFDGTIGNTNLLIHDSFCHVFNDYNIPYTEEDIYNAMGPTLEETFSKYTKNQKLVEELINYYREFNVRFHDKYIKPFDGVCEVIRDLYNRGYEMAIITSKTKELAYHGCEYLNIADCFKVYVGSYEVKKHKPNPEVIYKALEVMSKKGDTLVVGDNPSDIEAAKNANVFSCGVSWSFKKDDLINTNPDFMLNKMEDIYQILEVK